MFSFIKNTLQKIFSQVTSQLGTLFGKTHIDQEALKELEILLLSSDVGVKTTQSIITQLKTQIGSTPTNGAQLKSMLNEILLEILSNNENTSTQNATVFLLVGINGSGKTTSIGKLAQLQKTLGKKVLLVAADTFRAAATEQLAQWAHSTQTDIVCGKEGQDPASVIFQGCEKFKNEQYDILIIDTAGRLQTKVNLMHELAKIKRVVTKQLPHNTISTLLTIDGMLGQNSFEQAKLFKESTDVDGIILTKMDGTGKGGIVFAIAQSLNIPIAYLTFGEQADHIKLFNAKEYVTGLLG
jgi:fused signal recognition particle receptor